TEGRYVSAHGPGQAATVFLGSCRQPSRWTAKWSGRVNGSGPAGAPWARPPSLSHTPPPRSPFAGADIGAPAPVAVPAPWPGTPPLVEGGGGGFVAAVDGGAARQQGVRQGRPAVVLERAQLRVERLLGRAYLVAVDPEAGAARAVADQVVPLADEVPRDVVPGGRSIQGAVEGDDRVPDDGPIGAEMKDPPAV